MQNSISSKTPNAWNAWGAKQNIANSLFPQPENGGMTAAERLRRLQEQDKPMDKVRQPDGERDGSNEITDTPGNLVQAKKNNCSNLKGGKKKTTGPVHNSRYKAKLCKNWMKNGSCPYFEKCQFAHGSYELEKWANRRARMKTEQPATSQIQSTKSNNQSDNQEDDYKQSNQEEEEEKKGHDDDEPSNQPVEEEENQPATSPNTNSPTPSSILLNSSHSPLSRNEGFAQDSPTDNNNNVEEQQVPANMETPVFTSHSLSSDPFADMPARTSTISPVRDFLPDLTSKLEEIGITNAMHHHQTGSESFNVSPFSSDSLFQPLPSLSSSMEEPRFSSGQSVRPASQPSSLCHDSVSSTASGSPFSAFSAFSAFQAQQPAHANVQLQQQQQQQQDQQRMHSHGMSPQPDQPQYFEQQSASPSFQLFGMKPIFEGSAMGYMQFEPVQQQAHPQVEYGVGSFPPHLHHSRPQPQQSTPPPQMMHQGYHSLQHQLQHHQQQHDMVGMAPHGDMMHQLHSQNAMQQQSGMDYPYHSQHMMHSNGSGGYY